MSKREEIVERLKNASAAQAMGGELLTENEYLRLQLKKSRDKLTTEETSRINELETSYPHLKACIVS